MGGCGRWLGLCLLLALAGCGGALQNVTAQLFGAEAYGTLAAFGDFNSDKQTDLFVLRGGECERRWRSGGAQEPPRSALGASPARLGSACRLGVGVPAPGPRVMGVWGQLERAAAHPGVAPAGAQRGRSASERRRCVFDGCCLGAWRVGKGFPGGSCPGRRGSGTRGILGFSE